MTAATDQKTSPTVLLVEPDADVRDLYGTWLEDAGMDAINCPGPHMPGFTCLGTCDRPCPLTDVADVAVLDMRRLPGLSRRGLPGWRLLRHYLARGKPVVVIADNFRKDRSFRPEQVFVLRPNPSAESLMLAIRAMLRETRKW